MGGNSYGAGAGGQSSLWIYLIVAALIVLRLVRSGKQQPVRPLVLLLTTALVLYGLFALVEFGGSSGAGAGASAAGRHTGIDPSAIPFYGIGAILGLALGVLRARTVSYVRDAATGQVLQRASPWVILIWLGLFVLRFLVRYLASRDLIGAWATPLSDVLLVLGTCSVLGLNLYSLLRFWQLSHSSAVVQKS